MVYFLVYFHALLIFVYLFLLRSFRRGKSLVSLLFCASIKPRSIHPLPQKDIIEREKLPSHSGAIPASSGTRRRYRRRRIRPPHRYYLLIIDDTTFPMRSSGRRLATFDTIVCSSLEERFPQQKILSEPVGVSPGTSTC